MDYTLLKRDALVALCSERGIKHLSHKTKTQMVNLLMAYDAELEESRRMRERRRAARKAPLPPILPVKKKKSGLENLEPAAPLKFADGIADGIADAARIAAEPVGDSYAARVAVEQAAMIAADADVAPPSQPQQQPKPCPHLLTVLLRHYWNYPLLLTALFAPSYKPQAMIQEGQLFPIVHQNSMTYLPLEKLNLINRC